MTRKASDLTSFERHLRNYEGIRYRLARGLNTGRNANGTAGSLELNMQRMRELVRTSDAVTDALDARPSLARRWSRAERQHVGLPT